MSAADGICPSSRYDAPRSPSLPDLNGRGCLRPKSLSPSLCCLVPYHCLTTAIVKLLDSTIDMPFFKCPESLN